MQNEMQYELRILHENGGFSTGHMPGSNDQDAMNYASLAANSQAVEVWQESRLVGSIPPRRGDDAFGNRL